VTDKNMICAMCGTKVENHILMTHPFYGGDTPDTRYEGDISAFRKAYWENETKQSAFK